MPSPTHTVSIVLDIGFAAPGRSIRGKPQPLGSDQNAPIASER